MTNQEAYDLIREYFTRPRAELTRIEGEGEWEGGYCRYRTDYYGWKCAVGCLIPDEMHSRDFEEKSVENLVKASPEVAKLLGMAAKPSGQHGAFSFLAEAQYRHDDADTVPDFIDSLDALARKFGLKVQTGEAA